MDKVQVSNKSHVFAQDVAIWVSNNVESDFRLRLIKLDWTPSRRSSRGGIYAKGPGINIAMASAYPTPENYLYRFYEYPSYDNDKVIGGFLSKNSFEKTKAIICHEIAHAIQFFSYDKNKIRCKPHGPIFKKYYTILREEFINPFLSCQNSLNTEYTDIKRYL